MEGQHPLVVAVGLDPAVGDVGAELGDIGVLPAPLDRTGDGLVEGLADRLALLARRLGLLLLEGGGEVYEGVEDGVVIKRSSICSRR